jgi:predicted RNA-binding protein with PUA-like domain
MARWLLKQEPSCYSFDDLVRDGATVWDGVSNPLARKHLRQMRVGDRAFFYHTGKEKAVVGEMVVIGGPRLDPKAKDEAAVVIEVQAVKKFSRPVTLARIKSDPSLAKWDLVRMSRLSVVPVTATQWKRVQAISHEEDL